jgi:hypothetical protein
MLSINKQLFHNAISNLPKGKVQQKLGDTETGWVEERILELLTEEDKKIIDRYLKLEGDKVPDNWKEEHNKLPLLEKEKNDLKTELEKRPSQELFNQEKEKVTKLEKELEETKEIKKENKELAKEKEKIEKERDELLKTEKKLNQKIEDLKREKDNLELGSKNFAHITHEEWTNKKQEVINLSTQLTVRTHERDETLEQLKNRPNTTLTEWVNDWSKRPSKSELDKLELEVKEWRDTFKCKSPIILKDKLKELENTIESLKKRPDIPITKEEWEKDWSKRVVKDDSDQKYGILVKERDEYLKKLNELKKDLEEELEISTSDNWKEELIKLKRNRTIENRIKRILGIDKKHPLPSDWIIRLVKKESLEEIKEELRKAEDKSQSWISAFPKYTPEGLLAEFKNLEALKTQITLLTEKKEELEKELETLKKIKIDKSNEQKLKDEINKLNQRIKELVSEKENYSNVTKEEYQKLLALLKQKYPNSVTIGTVNKILFKNAISNLSSKKIKEKLGDVESGWNEKPIHSDDKPVPNPDKPSSFEDSDWEELIRLRAEMKRINDIYRRRPQELI